MRLAAARDSIENVVTANQVIQARLRRERDDSESEARALREVVTVLERERKHAQLTVRTIGKTGELQLRLRETFPELAAASWGLTHCRSTPATRWAWNTSWCAPGSEAFIIDHQNAAAWEGQKDQLLAVDSLRLQAMTRSDEGL